jgi:hypothetical protein
MGLSATTLSYISIASSAVGTGLTVMGNMQRAQGAKDRATYQTAIARNNQTIQQYKEQDALKRGEVAKQEHRQKVERLKGTQRAALAASGFDVNSDDALDILADTAEIGELDALTIDSNAKREAWGYGIEAQNASNQATLYDFEAANQSPLMAGASALFDGVGSVADKWFVFKREPKIT